MTSRIVIGCMTGTSIDGIDAATVRIDGRGLGLRVAFLRGASRPLGPVAESLRQLAHGAARTAGAIAAAAREFALEHVAAIRDLAIDATPDFVAIHGQTLFHAPPLSWQLLNPAPIAAAFGVPVVHDFRAADLAAGGQGAPITPLADYICLAAPGERRVVINLGGFANYTALPRRTDKAAEDVAAIAGGDICACNQLLDGLAQKYLNRDYDPGGAAAASGRPIADFAAQLARRLLLQQAGGRRSLGSGDEPHTWTIDPPAGAAPADILASATEAIGRTIGARLPGCERILIAGGSAANRALRAAISRCSGARVEDTDAYGIPGRYREAAEIAVLGALCADGVPITLPQITSVAGSAPLAGCWVPASHSTFGRRGEWSGPEASDR